jgi:hypothetical protein
MQYRRAFHCRMRFRCHFQCQKLQNYIENAFDSETHIQTADQKCRCNRLLSGIMDLILEFKLQSNPMQVKAIKKESGALQL